MLTIVHYGNGVQTRFEVPGNTSRRVFVNGVLTTPASADFQSVTLAAAPALGTPVGIHYAAPTNPIPLTTYNPAAVAITGGTAAGLTSVLAVGPVTASGPIRGALANTPNAVVGAAVLTAASLVGGVITRSGSTAAYTDTTDTAAAIVAAVANAQVGTSFDLLVINTVAFAQTLAAGAGVTLAGTTALAASSTRRFIGTITNVTTPAVTLLGISSGSL